MSRITDDPNDPGVVRGPPGGDPEPVEQNAAYLVLSAEERAKGYVRPVRTSYRHVGPPGPRYPLRALTDEECERYAELGYVSFESYPENDTALTGRFWTQAELDAAGNGCGAVTTMSAPIAETYARNPQFYGLTFCVRCSRHLPVGVDGEFVWDGTEERVGT